MTGKERGNSDSFGESEVMDDEAFDRWFEPAMDPKNCDDLADINPSEPEWQIRLHFNTIDPRESGEGPGYEDFKKLKLLETIGLLSIEFEGSTPRLVLVIKHQEGSDEERFFPDQIELFKRYAPIAKASPSSRHSFHKVAVPEDQARATLIAEKTDEVRTSIAIELLADEQAFRNDPIFYETDNRRIYEFDFSTIILTFSYNHEGHEQIRAKLRSICDEENLVLKIKNDEEAEYFDILIEKKKNETYADRKMKESSIRFLAKLKGDVQNYLEV